MTAVVVISASGHVSDTLGRLGLPAAGDTVAVVAWNPVDEHAAGVEEFVLGQPASRLESAFSRMLSRNRVTRYLCLILWDVGRKLLRAARSRADVRDALAGADVIVTTERNGVLTAWYASRHWAPKAQVVYGVVAAATLLQLDRRTARPTAG